VTYVLLSNVAFCFMLRRYSKGWTSLVVPGMLVGNFGNALASFAGLGLAQVFRGMLS